MKYQPKPIVCPYKATHGNKCWHKKSSKNCPYKNPKKCPYYNEWVKLKIIDYEAIMGLSDSDEERGESI